jgi:hypothetical protein
MNSFLAKSLASINVVLAVLIFVVMTISGATTGMNYGGAGMLVVGTVFGGVCGLVIASLVCGTIAVLTLVERHLNAISHSLKQPGAL